MTVGGSPLRERLRRGERLAGLFVQAPHPVFGALDMYQWLLFVGAHEGRHADQIREIGEALRAHEQRRATTAAK